MNGVNETVLTGDQAVTVESFTELNSKLGAQWFVNNEFTLGAGATVDYVFDFNLTEGNRVVVKSWSFDSDDQLTFNLYWKLTDWTNLDGTTEQVKNFFDYPVTSSFTTVQINPTAGTAPTEDNRLITILTPQTSNQSRQGAFRRSAVEYVLSQRQQMIFRFFNDTGGAEEVNFEITWYEGPLSTDRKRLTGGGF